MADMASELEAIAVRLRRAGEEDLARELAAGMRRGVRPVPDQILERAAADMPKRGGYAETLSEDLDVKTSVSPGGTNSDAYARVYAKTRSGRARKLKRLDAGELTHPVFGNREKWRTQEITPRWFTGPCEDAAPQVLAELERARDDISAKAEGRVP